jgi:hypothetical protein
MTDQSFIRSSLQHSLSKRSARQFGIEISTHRLTDDLSLHLRGFRQIAFADERFFTLLIVLRFPRVKLVRVNVQFPREFGNGLTFFDHLYDGYLVILAVLLVRAFFFPHEHLRFRISADSLHHRSKVFTNSARVHP